jgi:hypothetical protein
MALSGKDALRHVSAFVVTLAFLTIGGGAAVLIKHADPKIVFPMVGFMAVIVFVIQVRRPKWTEDAAAASSKTWWMPGWMTIGVIRHENWERSAAERRERVAREAKESARAAEKAAPPAHETSL